MFSAFCHCVTCVYICLIAIACICFLQIKNSFIHSFNNSKESEIKIQSGQTNYQLETSNYEFADPVCLFEMQVSPQFISEEGMIMKRRVKMKLCVLLNQSSWGKVTKESLMNIIKTL